MKRRKVVERRAWDEPFEENLTEAGFTTGIYIGADSTDRPHLLCCPSRACGGGPRKCLKLGRGPQSEKKKENHCAKQFTSKCPTFVSHGLEVFNTFPEGEMHGYIKLAYHSEEWNHGTGSVSLGVIIKQYKNFWNVSVYWPLEQEINFKGMHTFMYKPN